MVKSKTALLEASSILNAIYDHSVHLDTLTNICYTPKIWQLLLCTFDSLLYECIGILNTINFKNSNALLMKRVNSYEV